MKAHATGCCCTRCLTIANAMAWANAKERKPAGAEVIAGLLLREMPPTAALRELLRAVRYVKLAQEAEQTVVISAVTAPTPDPRVQSATRAIHARPALRLVGGGKSEEDLVKDWERKLP